ncbi:MAG: hypothetical protein V3U84_08435 [Thiotrichaceae bacterium]
MRSIREAEIVSAQVRKFSKTYSKFESYYDDMVWRLAKDPEIGSRIGSQIPGHNPPTYVVETAAMRPLGIPKIMIIFSVGDNYIEIKSLAVYEA